MARQDRATDEERTTWGTSGVTDTGVTYTSSTVGQELGYNPSA